MNEFPEHFRRILKRAIKYSQLDEALTTRLEKLLCKHAGFFANSAMDLERTELVQHDITMNDTKPIRQSTKRLPKSQQEKCEKEMQAMLEKGIIEAGQSPWVFPVAQVRKKDGTFMMPPSEKGHVF